MITVIQVLMLLGLIVLPLFKKAAKKQNQPIVYKNDIDTTNAQYAINQHGYLEEVAGKKVHG
jgi:hypothetical protein